MSSIDYSLQFEALCGALGLGDMISEPEALLGGLMHRMYVVHTNRDKYVVKALNPKVMLRPGVIQNIINSEKIAERSAICGIPALPAKVIKGEVVQQVGSQYYLVFDWIDGKNLKGDQLDPTTCEKIGEILAGIHSVDFRQLGIARDSVDAIKPIDWSYYVTLGQEQGAPWIDPLCAVIEDLDIWNTRACEAEELLSRHMIISHRDMDPKNVMWNQGRPIIIDWEAAGYVNPARELLETALSWSDDGAGGVCTKRFEAFAQGYAKGNTLLDNANWPAALFSVFSGKLAWLEYNVKRALWLECTDEDENRMGIAQVLDTLLGLRCYANHLPTVERLIMDNFCISKPENKEAFS